MQKDKIIPSAPQINTTSAFNLQHHDTSGYPTVMFLFLHQRVPITAGMLHASVHYTHKRLYLSPNPPNLTDVDHFLPQLRMRIAIWGEITAKLLLHQSVALIWVYRRKSCIRYAPIQIGANLRLCGARVTQSRCAPCVLDRQNAQGSFTV